MQRKTRFSAKFDFYGVKLKILTGSVFVYEDLLHDFKFFLSDRPFKTPVFTIRTHFVSPPKGISMLKTRRSRIYLSRRKQKRVLFFDKAYVDYRFDKGCHIFCQDEKVLFEVCYQVILSYVGERLDLKGMHRVHGLGLSVGEEGAIILAPSGGGKSTLAMDLLHSTRLSILSDDTPLISKRNKMVAFPQRIALAQKPRVPEKFLRIFSRVHHGEKFVVCSEYFSRRIQKEAKLRWMIILGQRRCLEPTIRKAHRVELIWPLLKWLVLGIETPQIWELFLRFDRPSMFSKLKILRGRFFRAFDILKDVKFLYLSPSEVSEKNAKLLGDWIKGESF